MKIGNDTYVTIFSEDIEDIESGNKTGGIEIEIEGKILLKSRDNYHKVTLHLSRKECKALRKLIREKE